MCIRDRVWSTADSSANANVAAPSFTWGSASVSYTHLDVYKRQPWGQKDAIRPTRLTMIAADLGDASFKTTRATYGKLLLIATKDIELVAKALGQSDSRITRKHYAAILPSEVKAGIGLLPSLGFDTESNVVPITKKNANGS